MPVRGACDSCKRRKVKCDETDTCANCRISRLRCQRTIPPRKRGRKVTKRPTDDAAAASSRDGHLELAQVSDCNGQQQDGPSDVGSQHGSTPQNLASLCSPKPRHVASTLDHYCQGSRQIHESLVAEITSVLTAEAVLDTIHRYIDYYMQYQFPNSPIFFESDLRAHASLLWPQDDANPLFSSEPDTQLASMKGFAIITAMCASITSAVTDSLVPHGQLLSVSFLHASRAMLRLYEDYDLEHPDSSSLLIRQWHSVALQNMTGKTGSAWHHHGEAALLAQRLCLYSEDSLRGLASRESQLRRACFWQLYLTDIAGVATGTRHPVLNEALFEGGLTLSERGDGEETLLDLNKSCNQAALEERLIAGFHFKFRLWFLAANIIQDVKAHSKQREGDANDSRLVEAYLEFAGLVDELPSWLQRPDDAPDPTAAPEVRTYQATCFWMQRCSIVSAFYCLKLVILQHCVESGMPGIMGFSNHATSLAMKKIEIAHDFLQDLHGVPFPCLKTQGETGVQRIRRVGTMVLQVGQTVDHETIKARSKSLLTRLLDLLARLDSKASDSMSV